MIRVVHPESESWIRIRIFLPIPDPGVKKATDPGSGSATLPLILLCSLFLSQLKRELVVSCCGELIALHTEIANLIVDVASVVDTETQVGKTISQIICYRLSVYRNCMHASLGWDKDIDEEKLSPALYVPFKLSSQPVVFLES